MWPKDGFVQTLIGACQRMKGVVTMYADAARDQVVVIVGAGVTGGNVAVTLRQEGWKGRILLLGSEQDVPFGRPPLSKTYLRGEEDLSAWRVKPADWYGAHDVELRTGVSVAQVNTAQRQVRLTNGETVDYQRLALCMGGRNRTFTVPGATLPGVYQLRAVAECEAIRQVARPGAHAVIVGMGFIGAEVAASLRQMGLEVIAVLSGAAPLANVLGDDVASALATIHREHGVQLVTNDQVIALEGGARVERALTKQGRRLGCDLVVVGIGIEPAVEAVAGSAIACDNGILVDERCQTNVPDVFAAGDVANVQHPVFGRVRVEHYNNAERQGRALARAMLGDPKPYDYIYSFWSDQYEHKLEYVGYARSWERIVLRGSYESRHFLAFYLTQGVLQAVCGLNRGGDPEIEADSELRACQRLIGRRAHLAEATLADERVDLRELAADAR
jgi:3-phenylpropionate/trans-cinnamate dioxygenase ferredoxin reductase subunit